jgi:hypothetical protein
MANLQQAFVGNIPGSPGVPPTSEADRLNFVYTAGRQDEQTTVLRFFDGGYALVEGQYTPLIQVGSAGGLFEGPAYIIYHNIDVPGSYRPSFRHAEGAFTVDNTGFPTPAIGDLVEIVHQLWWDESNVVHHDFSMRVNEGTIHNATSDSGTARSKLEWQAQNITLGRAFVQGGGTVGNGAWTNAAIFPGRLTFEEALAAL